MKFKGVNFGGWLMMEGYILGGPNIPESKFKREFAKANGEAQLQRFCETFRDNFIREDDFANAARLGAQVVRIPFHYKVPVKYLERAARMAQDHGLKVILDLHAAPGSQNHDWHSDSLGLALLWQDQVNQEKTFLLWEELAEKFKDDPAVLGYDLLNEPVLHGVDAPARLTVFYKELIRRIRAVDKEKILFVEGNQWAQQIDFLADLIGKNIVISIHGYEPGEFTLNIDPSLAYPGPVNGTAWDDAAVRRYLERYHDFAQKHRTSIYVGEFGVNWRGGHCGEARWLSAALKAFDDFDFSWTYWTYKAVGGYMFPDGLYRHGGNGDYVRRIDPIHGNQTYISAWERESAAIIDFWRTDNFQPVQPLIDLLFS